VEKGKNLPEGVTSVIYTHDEYEQKAREGRMALQKIQDDILTTPGYLNKEQIEDYLMVSDSFNRFPDFLKLLPKLVVDFYWYALRRAYEGSDSLFEYRYVLKRLFRNKMSGRKALMNSEEQAYLKKLPKTVTIYRGMTAKEHRSNEYGISWTLEEESAHFFAFTYWRNLHTSKLKKIVVKAEVEKKDIVAFFNDREEFEIIYLKRFKSRQVKQVNSN
jgi:hypothetical protein